METVQFFLMLLEVAKGLTWVDAATYAVVAWLLTTGLYVGFMAYAGIKAAKARPEWELTPRLVRSFAWTATAFFGIADVVFNWTVGSAIYFEVPREFLFTTRCNRHLYGPAGKRQRIAQYICHGWLNPIDPGHCK